MLSDPGLGVAAVTEPLAYWHDRLHENFESLRDDRERHTPGRPVFALEHNLDLDSDLPELMGAVRSSIASSTPLSRSHWLPTIVYAAEIGYDYQGESYWPGFESQTPCWTQLGNVGRDYIRQKFRDFADTYGGAKPSGRWAEWFTIIAWPITHAVLPVYLQRQLARLLYDYRYVLTAELLQDHKELGTRLASHSHNSSDRFRNFAQNSSLLGLVAASLLLEDEEESDLLKSSTLRRIVGDLRRERQAGEWLRSAQRRATTVRRGFLRAKHDWRRLHGLTSSDLLQSSQQELELSVRRTARTWTVYVTIPSHQSLARQFPEFRRELQRIRYRLDGVTKPRVQPRGALMYERGPFPLARFPVQGASVLDPEGATATLRQLLVDSCRVPRGPWLFHLREANYGTEIRTKQVRPGHRYLIMNSTMTQIESSWCVPVALSTVGAQAHELNVPDNVNASMIQELSTLGVGVISDARVWPAGLVPARWDGAGRAAWRLGDTPVIGLQTNRAASTCRVTIAESHIDLPWPEGDDIIFLKLVDLNIGTHLVKLAIYSNGLEKLIAEGRIEVRIMEPADSLVDSRARQGLRVMSHPAQPTFSDIWTGDAAIVVDGPPGERVSFKIHLLKNRSRDDVVLTPFSSKLPVNDERWRALWNTAHGNWLANHGEAGLFTLSAEARELVVSVSNPKLGSVQVHTERPFAPLQWFQGSDGSGSFAKLVDLTDRRDIALDYYDVRSPCDRREPHVDEWGLVRSEHGGLVVASVSGYQTGIILPAHLSGSLQSLYRLSVRPSIRMGDRSRESIFQMAELARLWTRVGSVMDSYGFHQQSIVNDTIVTELSRVICGDRWWRLIESQIRNGIRPTYYQLLTAAGDTPKEEDLALRLQELATSVSPDPFERSIRFSEVLGLNLQSLDIVSNIVRLATAPGALSADQTVTKNAVDLVLAVPSVFRLARGFVAAIANYGDVQPFSTLRNWPW